MSRSSTTNRTIKLTVVGAQQALPAGLRGSGKDCIKPVGPSAKGAKAKRKAQTGNGQYYYIASPAAGKAVLVHSAEDHTGADKITEWHSSKRADAPRLGGKVVTDVQAQSALDKMNMVLVKEAARALSVPPMFKGTWKGYIECTSSGPVVVVYRDLAYARMALVSELDKSGATWEWAIVMKPRESQKWFVKPAKQYSGKGKRTFKGAFDQAMNTILKLIGEACTVKTITTARHVKAVVRGKKLKGGTRRVKTAAARRAEMKSIKKVRSRPKISAKAQTAADKLPASVKKLVGKKAKILRGIRGLRKDDLVKVVKIDRYGKTINLHVQHIVHEAGGKGRLSKTLTVIPFYSRAKDAKTGKMRNFRRVTHGVSITAAFDYALRHGLKNIAEVRAAKKSKKSKVAASQSKKKAASKTSTTKASTTTRKARIRSYEKRTAAQRALGSETRYIKFKGKRHNGHYARIDRTQPNATGNADPKSGGVLMDVVLIVETGGVSKSLNEMVNGKRDFSKVSQAGYEAAKKKAATAKKKADKKALSAEKKAGKRTLVRGSKVKQSAPVATTPPLPPIPDIGVTVITGEEIRGGEMSAADLIKKLKASRAGR